MSRAAGGGGKRKNSLGDRRTTTPAEGTPAWKERAYRKASWRLALKVAARTSIRALGRSTLIVAMVALPVTGMVAIAVLADSMFYPSIQQRIDTELGNTQAKILVETTPGSGMRQNPLHPEWYLDSGLNEHDLKAPKDALPPGTRIIVLTTTSVSAKTATGAGRITVLEGESWDPSLSGISDVTVGRAPRSDREVLVTAAALPRLGAKVGDSIDLRGATNRDGESVSSVTIVGIMKYHTHADSEEWIFAKSGALSSSTPQQNLQNLQNTTYYLPDTTISWDEVKDLNADGLGVLSRTVMLNPPPNNGGYPVSDQLNDIVATATPLAIVAGFAAFEVILLAGAAFTVTARQQQRTLATIASVGAPRKLLFRILTANGIVLGVIGGLFGVVFGIGTAALFMALTANGSTTQYYGLHLPWLAFLAVVGFAVLIGWLASLAPARATSRFDIVSALRGTRKPPPATAKRPIVGLIFLLSGVTLTLVGGALLAVLQEAGRTLPDGHPLLWVPTVMLIVGPILAQLGLILIGPLVLRGIAKLLGGSGLGARLASRDSARNPGRAVPALAAVMTTVFVAVFGMCVVAGSDAASRDSYQWMIPFGSVQAPLIQTDYSTENSFTSAPYPHPELVEQAIRNSVSVDHLQRIATVLDWHQGAAPSTVPADGIALPVIPMEDLCPANLASPEDAGSPKKSMTVHEQVSLDDPRCKAYFLQMKNYDSGAVAVTDTAGLRLALGHEPSTAAKRTLNSGGAVSFSPKYVQDGMFSLSWWAGPQLELLNRGQHVGVPIRTETLPAVVELPEHPMYNFGVFISKSTADRLNIRYQDSLVLASTTTVPTTQQQDALREAMLALPGNNKNGSLLFATVETGPSDQGTPVVWGLLGLAGLIAIASSAIAIGLARFDGRQDDATLSALGAGRMVRRSFALWQAIIIAGIGSILGAVTGLVPAWALAATGLPFVPPWIPIGIAVVALPLLIACGSWLLATRSKVSARRVAIA